MNDRQVVQLIVLMTFNDINLVAYHSQLETSEMHGELPTTGHSAGEQ